MNCLAPLITHSPSVELGRGPGGASVGAGVRLGQPERGQPPAGAQLGQPLGALLVGAPQVDRHGAQRGVGGDGDPHRRVHPRQLLDRERVGEACRRRRRRTPPGTGCPSGPARRAWRRSRRGSSWSGRAPRRPAAPPGRRSRGRCRAAAAARRSGRSPWPNLRGTWTLGGGRRTAASGAVAPSSPESSAARSLDPARGGPGGNPGRAATQLDQPPLLIGVLDALGDHVHAQARPEVDDRADDRRLAAVADDLRDEGAVDLQHVHREPGQVPERRVAGAEVVDGEADPQLLQLGEPLAGRTPCRRGTRSR